MPLIQQWLWASILGCWISSLIYENRYRNVFEGQFLAFSTLLILSTHLNIRPVCLLQARGLSQSSSYISRYASVVSCVACATFYLFSSRLQALAAADVFAINSYSNISQAEEGLNKHVFTISVPPKFKIRRGSAVGFAAKQYFGSITSALTEAPEHQRAGQRIRRDFKWTWGAFQTGLNSSAEVKQVVYPVSHFLREISLKRPCNPTSFHNLLHPVWGSEYYDNEGAVLHDMTWDVVKFAQAISGDRLTHVPERFSHVQ